MSHNNSSADIWLAGAFAAFTVDLIIYPLDTIKTRLQSGVARPPPLSQGLYQGAAGVILATLPSSGAFFTVYEGVKYGLGERGSGGKDDGDSDDEGLLPKPVIHATASATAELVSCAILAPAEVIKQNAQMVERRAPSTSSLSFASSATAQALSKFRSNPLGLWRGYAALAGRNLPLTAMQFPLFERFKREIKSKRDRNGTRTNTLLESGLITAVSAGGAGALAAVVTTPVDVVKTKIMLAAGEEAASSSSSSSPPSGHKSGGEKGLGRAVKEGVANAVSEAVAAGDGEGRGKRKSAWTIGREIYDAQGVRGLFRGGALRAVWTMMGAGLYLGVYESGRVYLAKRRGLEIDEDDIF